jgi:hypothetical protein
MLKRALLVGVICVMALTFIGMSPSAVKAWGPYRAMGKVETPNGQAVVGIPVRLYEGMYPDYTYRGTVYTGSNGYWEAYFPYCGMFITASIGPPEKHGTQQASNLIICSWFETTVFATIVLDCGGPHEPPCPQM